MREDMSFISCDVGHTQKAKFLVWDGTARYLAVFAS